ENATAALEEGMHFDFNATPIMEFMNNDSLVGGCEVNNMILSVIPQVYSASLATGVERDTTLEPGEHGGYETSYNVGLWGEPDSMEQIVGVIMLRRWKGMLCNIGVYTNADLRHCICVTCTLFRHIRHSTQ
ncbi:hypothetical protein C5S42_08850, partial [Candidatus Methanomarinus sp.]